MDSYPTSRVQVQTTRGLHLKLIAALLLHMWVTDSLPQGINSVVENSFDAIERLLFSVAGGVPQNNNTP